MTPKDLDEALRCWGGFYRQGMPPAEDRSLTGIGFLGKVGRAVKDDTVGRDGRERRRMMARELAATGTHAVPMWAVTPVSGTQTRSHRLDHYDSRETTQVEQVQAAWESLRRQSPLQAQVVRCEYQVRGGQEVAAVAAWKAIEADRSLRDYREQHKLDGLPLRRYRDELRLGKVWMLARMSA